MKVTRLGRVGIGQREKKEVAVDDPRALPCGEIHDAPRLAR